MKKNSIYVVISAVIVLCLLSIGLLFYGKDLSQPSGQDFPIYNSENLESVPSGTVSSSSELLQEDKSILFDISNKIQINFSAGDSVYQISIPKDSSIYDAMTYLSASGIPPLVFEAENYPSLGYFVKSINGVRNSGGYYWTLYVNGQYSTLGATQYILKEGDKIEWKYVNNPNN